MRDALHEPPASAEEHRVAPVSFQLALGVSEQRSRVSWHLAATVNGDHPGGSQRHASGPTQRPAGKAARLPTIPANEQRDGEAPEANAVNDAVVAAYRLSVRAGSPLSERRLAQMFGRTSRSWARARIADAHQASSIQDPPGAPVMA